MKRIRLPQNISYDNAEKEIVLLAKEISASNASEKIELDLEGVQLTTVNKAVIREIHKMFPDKIIIPETILKELLIKTEAESADEEKRPKKGMLIEIADWLNVLRGQIFFFCVIMVDMLYFSVESLWNRRFIVKNDTTKNAFYIGYKAVPIVFLLSFLIGLTISIQAALQMAKLGGQGYLAMLIGTAMMKELGPLITAIVISGRTGSSIAAEIGTMVVMEEVDALKTMGIRPLKFLLVPKFWAFTLAMPILTLIADLAGITGGVIVSSLYNVPASSFFTQLISVIKMSDVWWGTVKSLTFAWVILAIACYKGLNVRGGADAVGRATTESVVVSIFMVVVIDAIYSLILYT